MIDMNQECAPIIFCFQIIILFVKTDGVPIYNIYHVGHIKPHPLLTDLQKIHKQYCFFNSEWVQCTPIKNYNVMNSYTKKVIEEKIMPNHYRSPREYNKIQDFSSNMKSFYSEAQPVDRRLYLPNPLGMMSIHSLPDLQGKLLAKTYHMHNLGYTSANFFKEMQRPYLKYNSNNAMSMPHPHTHASSGLSSAAHTSQVNNLSNAAHSQLTLNPSVTMGVSSVSQQMSAHKNMSAIMNFTESLDHFERQFYMITFTKLTTISPADRQENGMSFVQSGFFLLLTLLALATEVDSNTRAEIDRCIGFQASDMDTIGIIKHFMSSLPDSSEKLKLRRSSRLMLWPGKKVSQRFRTGAAAALMLQVDGFNGTETSDKIATILNRKVEMDSGGAIHDTFDEDDVSGGVTAVLVTTLYVRGCWRTAPTVLNGSRTFHDHNTAPKRTVRMIKINDLMNYADLREWNAQALEISYATPGLSLLMLIPRGNSLRSLVQHVTNTSIGDITAKMRTMRVAATVPLYTLRMTLLLPNKLQAMNIQSLVNLSNSTQASSLKLSHAVQRIMFWAEAGRNAYKDDGIEWDQAADLDVVVDRPYIFFVRWRNVTLINGNFVL